MKQKIGITEAGDAGVNFSWAEKLAAVDGAVVITKDANSVFRDLAVWHRRHLICHITCTGYGGTVLEPHVPSWQTQLGQACQLVGEGFPIEKIVIRVDPIIPTKKGLALAKTVIMATMEMGFSRYRISLLDMYPHVQERFQAAGLPIPYHWSPSQEQIAATDAMLAEVKRSEHRPADLRIESCAEPGLKEAIPCGCISAYDLSLLGLDPAQADQLGRQRQWCLCCSGKTELLTHKQRCPHGCLYCYWKDPKPGR